MNEAEKAQLQEIVTKVSTLEAQMASMFHLYERALGRIVELETVKT